MARILVVDDDRTICQLVERILERQGHGVRSALSGPEGLSEAVAFEPDLVLLDVMLPGMNGYEVEQALARTDRVAHVPVVYMTGLLEGEEAELLGRRLRGRPVLAKPIRAATLRACVADELARRSPV